MKRRAFTLVELLVVVSIIALLIAILLPSLKKARDLAKSTVCLSNIRSLAVAVHQYASGHDGRLVSAGMAHGGNVDEHAAWINTLKADYGNELVARCPVDRSSHWAVPLPGTEQLRRSSYGTNYYTVKRIGDRGPYDRLELFKRPSTTIFMVELAEEGGFAAADHVHPETWWSNPLVLAGEELAYARHLKKANYSFMDAHAEPCSFEETFSIDYANSMLPNLAWSHNLYDPAIAR
ncbi:MAG: prepilin-type N-terminal cleavage/methylation domain-containing protein [bacterium]|nr:prepilin-type N-terminal cleavage/methylation domain-containing protein [bacterium]